jgi:hypothetical protein
MGEIEFTGDALAEPVNGYLRQLNRSFFKYNTVISILMQYWISKSIIAYPWVYKSHKLKFREALLTTLAHKQHDAI